LLSSLRSAFAFTIWNASVFRGKMGRFSLTELK
jgi:hypothetical protein